LDALKRMAAEGPHPTKIAEHFGVAYKVVRRWLREIDVEYQPKYMRPRGQVPPFGFILTSHTGKRIRTRLYECWASMRKRLLCRTNKDYASYGGRGVTMCAEWNDFGAFRAWALSAGYRKGLSLERIDNNGNYEPSNCRWIPVSEQQDNTRRVHHLTVNGVTRPLPWWARLTGLKASLINGRVRAGWPHERAVTEPVGWYRKATEKSGG
jgi:hypothetical protein